MKKKLLSIIGLLISIFALPLSVMAATISSNLVSSKTILSSNDTFTITINVSGLTNGLASADYVVNFDSSKFTYVSIAMMQGKPSTDILVNPTSSAVNISYMDGSLGAKALENGGIIVLTFKVKENIASGVATFGLSGSGYADKDAASLSGTTNGVNVTLRVLSNDATLGALSVTGCTLNPAFAKNVLAYSCSINAATTTINATSNAGGDTRITGIGNKSLKYGKNVYNVIVTAEAGNTKTYVVTIIRPDDRSKNNNLKSITLSSGTISFNAATTTYYVTLPGNTTTLTVNGIAADNTATVVNPSQTSFFYGQTQTLNIVVTAQNGSKKIYSIVATRPDTRSTNNYLKSLTVSEGSINFNKNTNSYVINVDNNIDTISVNAISEDSKAVIQGLGNTRLYVGSNIIKINVVAENTDPRLYTITVVRKDAQGSGVKLSDDATLKNLEIKNVNLNFKKDTYEYNIGVSNDVTKLDVTAVASNEKAEVILPNFELKDGTNKYEIKVIAENGTTLSYIIYAYKENPKTLKNPTDESINNSIKENAKPSIIIPEAGIVISSDAINSLKEQNKDLLMESRNTDNGLLYSVKLSGSAIDNLSSFNPLISYNSNNRDKILSLLQEKDAIIINLAQKDNFPKSTAYNLFVGDKYKDGTTLYLYSYQKNLVNTKTQAVVKDGYVEIILDETNEYVLSDKKVVEEKKVINEPQKSDTKGFITFIIGGLLIVGLLTGIIILLIKTIKNRKAFK